MLLASHQLELGRSGFRPRRLGYVDLLMSVRRVPPYIGAGWDGPNGERDGANM